MTPQFRRRLVRLRAIVAKVALLAALLAVAEVAAQTEVLATVVFASIDRERFARAAHLLPSQRITLAQSVGFAKP